MYDSVFKTNNFTNKVSMNNRNIKSMEESIQSINVCK